MKTIKNLLDAVKASAGIETDYALAKELGVHRQLVSSFYKGTRRPDNRMCLEIAERIKLPLERVIAIVEIEAEKDEARREAWKGYFKSIGGMAASFMLVALCSVTFFVTTATNAFANQAVSSSQSDTLQIMRSLVGRNAQFNVTAPQNRTAPKAKPIWCLAFEDASAVFEGGVITVADQRKNYGEPLFASMGMLRDRVVFIAYTAGAGSHQVRAASFNNTEQLLQIGLSNDTNLLIYMCCY